MLVLGLIPKLAFIVASVPQCVLGGAGFIMFGMVAATGIKILSTVDYAKQRHSVLVVAISIGFGLIPIVAPTFFHVFPDQLKPIFGDGIILTSIAAVALNAFFNRTSREQAEADTSSRRQPARTTERAPNILHGCHDGCAATGARYCQGNWRILSSINNNRGDGLWRGV